MARATLHLSCQFPSLPVVKVNMFFDLIVDNHKSMLNMFDAGEYMWALFVGHLVIEKLLKAYYTEVMEKDVPRTHDLYKLAMNTKIDLSEDQKDSLQYITLFNIETRYEEYKNDFRKKCTREFAEKNIEKIEGLRTWLKEKIRN